MNCPKCMAKNTPQAAFCHECGSPLPNEQGASKESVATVENQAPNDNHHREHGDARIIILRGGRRGKEFSLDMDEVVVGRWDPDSGAFPEVDLTNDDIELKISRRHARIYLQDGQYFLEDMGSLNGTYVNRGSRLQPGETRQIGDGDEIIFGKTFVRFCLS